MTVRQSLLAILDLGPCYGYQLRLEFERRTGAATALNVGQVYATLDRLERDGLATKGAPDAAGHVYYSITPAGSAAAAAWLSTAAVRPGRDDLAAKLALAMTLPGVDAASLIATQRARTAAELAALRDAQHEDLPSRMVTDALTLAARAELEWLDRCEVLLAEASPYALAAEPPKRGRPTKVAPV